MQFENAILRIYAMLKILYFFYINGILNAVKKFIKITKIPIKLSLRYIFRQTIVCVICILYPTTDIIDKIIYIAKWTAWASYKQQQQNLLFFSIIELSFSSCWFFSKEIQLQTYIFVWRRLKLHFVHEKYAFYIHSWFIYRDFYRVVGLVYKNNLLYFYLNIWNEIFYFKIPQYWQLNGKRLKLLIFFFK